MSSSPPVWYGISCMVVMYELITRGCGTVYEPLPPPHGRGDAMGGPTRQQSTTTGDERSRRCYFDFYSVYRGLDSTNL